MGFAEELTRHFKGEVCFDLPMKNFTAYKVGGKAKFFITPHSLKGVDEAITLCRDYGVRYDFLGNGTNVLISDDGFCGALISLKNLRGIRLSDSGVFAMAGANLSAVAEFAAENSLSGLEEFSQIPGTVGGAVKTNAGAFGKSISSVVRVVGSVIDGELLKRDAADCGFSYRQSGFKGEAIAFADFNLNKRDLKDIKLLTEGYKSRRRESQPEGRTCGSVFRNPENGYAGELIEKAGLKGCKIGGAYVSEKHANFIVCDKNATATDVFNLIKHVKEKVYGAFGVILTEEITPIGDFNDTDGRLSYSYDL